MKERKSENMMMKRISWSKVVLGLISLVLVAVIVKTVRAGAATAPQAKDRTHSERVLAGSSSNRVGSNPTVGGNGIVEPADREVKLASQVPGVVSVIHVKEGDHVEAGAALIELESSQEHALVSAAEADVALANAELARMVHGLRAEDVDAMVAESDAAKARADMSSMSLVRTETLAKGGAASAEELDRARQQSQDSIALARAADARRRAALAGSRSEDVMVARARFVSSKARLEEARARLQQLTIRAPRAGEVLQVKVRVGEYNTPAAGPLAIIGDTSKLQVRLDIDERDVGKIALNAHADIEADAFSGRKFRGRVVEIGRRMGRKNVRSDDPTERIDTKVLEVVVALEDVKDLVPGLRVMGYVDAR